MRYVALNCSPCTCIWFASSLSNRKRGIIIRKFGPGDVSNEMPRVIYTDLLITKYIKKTEITLQNLYFIKIHRIFRDRVCDVRGCFLWLTTCCACKSLCYHSCTRSSTYRGIISRCVIVANINRHSTRLFLTVISSINQFPRLREFICDCN